MQAILKNMKGLIKLHHLIHSLSKTEKRYISIELSKQRSKKGKIDLMLFNLLKKQNDLNEEKIVSHAEFDSTVKLIIRCNYLFEFILRCLIDYNYSREIEIAIGNHIRIIKNFILKGLHQYTHYHLNKAEKLAEKYEDLYRQGILCTLRKTIVNRSSSSHVEFFREIQKIEAKENSIHEKIINLNAYNNHLNHISVALKKNAGSHLDDETFKILKHIEESSYFTNEKNALTKKAKIVFHEVTSILGELMHHDYQRSLIHTEKQMILIREMESYEKAHSPAYINCLKYYCIFSSETGQFGKAKNALQELGKMYIEKSAAQNLFEKSLIFLNYIEAETHLTLVDHEVHRFQTTQARISEGIELYDKMFDSESRMILYYNLALRFMFMHEYKTAFRWLEKIFQEFHGMRVDILQNTHLLSLVCIYENESVNLFQSRERSYIRHYQNEKTRNPAHVKIIHSLSKIFQFKNNPPHIQKDLIEMKDFVSKEMKEYNIDRNLGETLLDWIDSKLEKKSAPATQGNK